MMSKHKKSFSLMFEWRHGMAALMNFSHRSQQPEGSREPTK